MCAVMAAHGGQLATTAALAQRQFWYQTVDAAWKTRPKQIGVSATVPPSWYEGEGCQWKRPGMLTFVMQFCCRSAHQSQSITGFI